VWESTYQGYTFHSGAIYYPSPLACILFVSDDLYDGGVITLEDACAYGIADAAQIYAVLPESYQAGTPDTRTGVAQLEDQALRQALEQLFRQRAVRCRQMLRCGNTATSCLWIPVYRIPANTGLTVSSTAGRCAVWSAVSHRRLGCITAAGRRRR